MIFDGARAWLRDIGVDIAPRVDPPAGRDPVSNALAGLVVMSVGRESPLQAAVNRALKTAGAVVMVKASAAEVLQMLAAFVPSAVVVEIVPGDDEGFAMVRSIRQRGPEHGGHLPVVGASGETIDPAAMIQAGFQEALVFPFDAADVSRAVLRALGRRI